MKRVLVIALLAACGVDEEPGVENVELESPRSELKINVGTCKPQYISAYLPLGSMWVSVKPLSNYICELQLGGETEDPSYSGGASQTCFFYRLGSITIDIGIGGPAHLDKSSCSDR